MRPINKMYAIPEKKKRYQMIKLKYTVRNSKKTKLNKQKTDQFINMLFRICMSLIPLQAMCHLTFNKSGYTFPL
jgi:hypothetical protein